MVNGSKTFVRWWNSDIFPDYIFIPVSCSGSLTHIAAERWRWWCNKVHPVLALVAVMFFISEEFAHGNWIQVEAEYNKNENSGTRYPDVKHVENWATLLVRKAIAKWMSKLWKERARNISIQEMGKRKALCLSGPLFMTQKAELLGLGFYKSNLTIKYKLRDWRSSFKFFTMAHTPIIRTTLHDNQMWSKVRKLGIYSPDIL